MTRRLHYVLLLLLVALCSCHEEKEAELLFDMIANSAPATTTMRYFANPGPGTQEKEYHIYTDFSASRIELECTNSASIDVTYYFRKPATSEYGDITVEATPEEAGIDINVSDGNIIRIDFAQLATYDTPYGYYGYITAQGNTGGKDCQTIINLARHKQDN